MPSVNFRFDQEGPRMLVGISAPTIYQTKTSRIDTWTALIDTGATISVVSERVVKLLDLPELGLEPLSSAGGGTRLCPTHEAQFRLGGHLQNKMKWIAITVFGVNPATPDIDAIIGMDILLKCNMTWNGRGRTGTISLK